MNNFEKLLRQLPSDTKIILQNVWKNLSQDDRNSFIKIINSFPTDLTLIRTLFKLTASQLQITTGRKNKVVIIGPANVGKSTLYNQLINKKTDLAEVSVLPGTTRRNQIADTGLFLVCDTPGADAIGDVGEQEKAEAMSAAESADFLVIMFDAIQGIKKSELDLFQELSSLDKPYLIVLNKIDLVGKELTKVIDKMAANLQVQKEQIIPIVAKTGKNVENMLIGIASLEPEIVAALGKALPIYRWQLARKSIAGAASISAVIALTPLPFIDFAPLIVTQSIMVLGIARIYDYKINLARARELVLTFGLGFLGRTLFYELSKLGGIPGWLLAAAIAASTTVVMGYAATVWFESGKKISSKTLAKTTREMTQYLIGVLKSLGRKKPGEKVLKEIIIQSLENMENMDGKLSD